MDLESEINDDDDNADLTARISPEPCAQPTMNRPLKLLLPCTVSLIFPYAVPVIF